MNWGGVDPPPGWGSSNTALQTDSITALHIHTRYNTLEEFNIHTRSQLFVHLDTDSFSTISSFLAPCIPFLAILGTGDPKHPR